MGLDDSNITTVKEMETPGVRRYKKSNTLDLFSEDSIAPLPYETPETMSRPKSQRIVDGNVVCAQTWREKELGSADQYEQQSLLESEYQHERQSQKRESTTSLHSEKMDSAHSTQRYRHGSPDDRDVNGSGRMSNTEEVVDHREAKTTGLPNAGPFQDQGSPTISRKLRTSTGKSSKLYNPYSRRTSHPSTPAVLIDRGQGTSDLPTPQSDNSHQQRAHAQTHNECLNHPPHDYPIKHVHSHDHRQRPPSTPLSGSSTVLSHSAKEPRSDSPDGSCLLSGHGSQDDGTIRSSDTQSLATNSASGDSYRQHPRAHPTSYGTGRPIGVVSSTSTVQSGTLSSRSVSHNHPHSLRTSHATHALPMPEQVHPTQIQQTPPIRQHIQPQLQSHSHHITVPRPGIVPYRGPAQFVGVGHSQWKPAYANPSNRSIVPAGSMTSVNPAECGDGEVSRMAPRTPAQGPLPQSSHHQGHTMAFPHGSHHQQSINPQQAPQYQAHPRPMLPHQLGHPLSHQHPHPDHQRLPIHPQRQHAHLGQPRLQSKKGTALPAGMASVTTGGTPGKAEGRINKGLRHFSGKVCEKVRVKGETTYNEVADELVGELTAENIGQDVKKGGIYDHKNIRRRVYDALNVLRALGIIDKKRKTISWVGLPTDSKVTVKNLMEEKVAIARRLAEKKFALDELILQKIMFQKLFEHNRTREVAHEKRQDQGGEGMIWGTEKEWNDVNRQEDKSTDVPRLKVPFVLLQSPIGHDVEVTSNDNLSFYRFRYKGLRFELQDEVSTMQKLGYGDGLEKGTCTDDALKRISGFVPELVRPYLAERASTKMFLEFPDDASQQPTVSTPILCPTNTQ
eukprot:CFRG5911T1